MGRLAAAVRASQVEAFRPQVVGEVVGNFATDQLTMEREKGFEPSTSTLARLHSTTELLPQGVGGDVL